MTTLQTFATHFNDTAVSTTTNDLQSMDPNYAMLPSRKFKTLVVTIIAVAAVIVLSSIVIFFLLIWKHKTQWSSNCDSNFSNSVRRSPTTSQRQEIVADFIIVGGGTAGCIVSARLAEYGFETLLLSSGSNDTLNPLIREKSLFNHLLLTSYFKHYLPTNPSQNLNNRTLDVVAWNTLGGSSINGGGIERLMKDEWDYFINATGDSSFHISTMSEYYKMVENFTSSNPFTALNIHGNNGPIIITQTYDSVFNNIWKNVANELNETFTNDLAGATDYGFSFEASSFTNGLRSWSCNAYLTSTLNKYPNLKVLTGATAIKFNINEQTKQIKNVLFVSKDGLYIGIARKEYILSAGTFLSPHLLMVSGIGDRKILQENNIPIKHELKQVGKNLMDSGVLFLEYQTQNLSVGQSIPVALINSQSRTTNINPDTFFILKEDNATKHLTVVILNASPKSTVGFISLYNSNPLMPPKISLDYLTDPRDLQTFINAINYLRKIMSTDAIKRYAEITELSPGLQETNLSAYVKNTITPSHHYVGTCAMGRNAENSVVDSQFKVHGINNLRVVDASVFPVNLSTKSGPFLTVHALAEKAAHILYKTYS